MEAKISLNAVLSFLEQFSDENKRWIADHLYEQVAASGIEESMEDIKRGRVAAFSRAEELFADLGI